ncbi:MAG: hypothetical protein GX275_07415 [Clostridiales bacterium]|nr:hypothetical protein [Clostridiales bacterium]
MAKPSIFSRDYERKMKKRKRRITITILLIIIVAIGALYKFKISNMDFSELKEKMQAWVDSGKPEEEIDEPKEIEENNFEEETKEEKEPEKTYVDLIVEEGVILKAEYTEENSNKKFIGIEDPKGLTYSISPEGKQVLITDKNQNLKLYDLNGNVTDITKQTYISGAGTPFPKNDILAANPQYLWHSQGRFIDETRVIYVSQMPYFGDAAVNKYIWIYDIVNKTEITLYNYASPEITLGELVQDKGISATINGANFFVNGEGVVTAN